MTLNTRLARDVGLISMMQMASVSDTLTVSESISTSSGGEDSGSPSNYTVTILQPAAGLNSNHRTKRAYPGLTYSVVVGCIGGAYPYTYSLSNAPAGMSVSADGIITWTNPQATATNVTLTVTDTKIFCGEWATRVGSLTPNMAGALGDGAWMTCMERIFGHCSPVVLCPAFRQREPVDRERPLDAMELGSDWI